MLTFGAVPTFFGAVLAFIEAVPAFARTLPAFIGTLPAFIGAVLVLAVAPAHPWASITTRSAAIPREP
ncbi:hypothetical protein [Streptomyces sp. NPDC001880]